MFSARFLANTPAKSAAQPTENGDKLAVTLFKVVNSVILKMEQLL